VSASSGEETYPEQSQTWNKWWKIHFAVK
jgi:hypothetical protein